MRSDHLPIFSTILPVLYEDDGQEELGDCEAHLLGLDILYNGIKSHLGAGPAYRVYGDMNLYYHPVVWGAYVSPDVMVVPANSLGSRPNHYRIDEDGPPPVLVAEVLSPRSAQQLDRTTKRRLYARLGVAEMLEVDVTGLFFPRRLRLCRRGRRSWEDVAPGPDGGVTSALGFGVLIEADGEVRVTDAATGWRYPRPGEAADEKRGREAAEARVRELEAELTRLRGTP